MMEAKDTVTETTWDNCHNTIEERLLEQAVIAFKAGQQNGLSLEMQGEAYCQGVLVGIRKVVGEIQKHNLYEKKNGHSFYHDEGISFETSESLDDRKWWQAKLKEWGIKND